MSLVLDLPSELESELASEAARLGIPLPEYALRLIAAGRGTRTALQTGAELLGYWQGEGLVGGCKRGDKSPKEKAMTSHRTPNACSAGNRGTIRTLRRTRF